MKKVIVCIIIIIGSLNQIFSAGKLTYEILKPALKPLPKDVQTLAFVYRNYDFPMDSITKFYEYNGEVYIDTANYKKTIVETVYYGFRTVLEDFYKSDTIPFIILPEVKGSDDRFIPPLSWNTVDSICSKHGSDVLVSLDDISIFNNYRTWYDGYEYIGVADINSFNSWTIYDPLTADYIFEHSSLDSLQSHQTATSMSRLVREKLPHRDDIMKVVAFSIGENVAKQIAPHWETIYREYFDSGSKEMRAASSYVKNKEWTKAINTWAEIQRVATNKYKARAAFNKAVILERLGKIDEALFEIQNSINIYKKMNKYEEERVVAEELKLLLELRKVDIAQLKLQQGE